MAPDTINSHYPPEGLFSWCLSGHDKGSDSWLDVAFIGPGKKRSIYRRGSLRLARTMAN